MCIRDRDSIASISEDQRIQLLLIGFCFNAFLEGAAGFGVPIAICAVLLICLLYTSDAADDTPCVDLGGRRIIKKSLNN
ncbi:hypothetical protein JMUB7554_27730 [Staphylococcus aureus]